jgi:arylsulfatase A-like enzyme
MSTADEPTPAPPPHSPPPTRLAPLLRADARRGARFALWGCAAFAVVEPIVTVALAQGPVRVAVALRFFLLGLTLTALLALFTVPLLGALFALPRLAWSALDRDAALAWPGLFAPGARPRTHVGAVPWVWAALVAAGAYGGASFVLTLRFMKRFKEPQLIAASLAGLQIGLFVVLALAAVGLGFLLRKGARALAARAPHLAPWNPIGRPLPMVALLGVAAVPTYFVLLAKMPQLRSVAPWRELVAAIVFTAGGALGSRVLADRRLLPAPPRRARVVAAGAAGAVLFAALTLTVVGADPETKYLAISASPPMARLVKVVRTANDFDRDGYGSLLGENDCAPLNKRIHPGARDIPDNGVDENCNGRDFSTRNAPSYKPGEKLAVPPEFKRDWNVLLVTIDTVRYDHTTMGGYKKRKGRDTTPNLARLAERSVNFEFAQAAAPGTMASIPAIIVSKFFHSGIHLGPERRPMPPKILDSNTTIGEVMKRGGYRTGAILSHEYFNDWGLEQGFDTYDNELGKKSDPFGIKSQDVTDKAQAWIARQGNAKWFLWAHYIDPHGRYVAHPGEVSWGSTEEDLYDGELRYTDKHLGRLLDFVAHTPSADRTVIIITSDHGDGFNEHGYINHGQKLYWELEHVPLVIYVPDAEPHVVPGPVSGLDIFPTVADLAGIDISDLDIEGVSLVPQLFYGRDARDRVVFAETNYPDPLRAAISADYKLIYNLKANVYELYDLRTDPGEKKNVWGRDLEGGQRMKAVLDEWIDRVFYSREAGRQAQEVRKQALLPGRPTPQAAADVTGGGAVRVIGYDVAPPKQPTDPWSVTLYFECVGETPTSYRLEASLVGVPPPSDRPPPPGGMVARVDRSPLDGMFPTSRWKKGEFIKETYALRAPPHWQAARIDIGFRLLDERRQPVPLTGSGVLPDGTGAILGALPGAPAPQPAPLAPQPTPLAPQPTPLAPQPTPLAPEPRPAPR